MTIFEKAQCYKINLHGVAIALIMLTLRGKQEVRRGSAYAVWRANALIASNRLAL